MTVCVQSKSIELVIFTQNIMATKTILPEAKLLGELH